MTKTSRFLALKITLFMLQLIRYRKVFLLSITLRWPTSRTFFIAQKQRLRTI